MHNVLINATSGRCCVQAIGFPKCSVSNLLLCQGSCSYQLLLWWCRVCWNWENSWCLPSSEHPWLLFLWRCLDCLQSGIWLNDLVSTLFIPKGLKFGIFWSLFLFSLSLQQLRVSMFNLTTIFRTRDLWYQKPPHGQRSHILCLFSKILVIMYSTPCSEFNCCKLHHS